MPRSRKPPKATPREVAHLVEVERQVRAFISGYYDPHNEKHDRTFAPGTTRFVEAVRPILGEIDRLRPKT